MDGNVNNVAAVSVRHIAKYKWGLANLVVSLRLNTFTKIELEKWLNEPFTPPPELSAET